MDGSREEKPYVRGASPPPDRLLRAGLRVLVVALAPVRPRTLARCHRRLRALLRGRRGSRANRRHGWCDDPTASDGALARGSTVVCGRIVAPCGDRPW